MTSDLKTQLKLLKELQEIDFKLLKIETELNEIPNRIADIQKTAEVARETLKAQEAEKANLEKNRRLLEKELDAEIERLKERELKLYAIKTNKEYQAALKEIADAKTANKAREDNVIQLMEAIDAAGEKITQLTRELADKENDCKAALDQLKKREDELTREKGSATAKRGEIEPRVEPDILRRYQQVQRRFPDALAVLVKDACAGCSQKVPPQLTVEVLKWKDIIICPNCQRILYIE